MPKLEVLSFNTITGLSKKTGAPYSMDIAQCVVHGDDGAKSVGEFMFPRDCKPALGFYQAAFGFRVNAGRIEASVLEVHKVSAQPITSQAPRVA